LFSFSSRRRRGGLLLPLLLRCCCCAPRELHAVRVRCASVQLWGGGGVHLALIHTGVQRGAHAPLFVAVVVA
jgi:hypothetical protein